MSDSRERILDGYFSAKFDAWVPRTGVETAWEGKRL